MSRPLWNASYSLPAPVGGWNARDPLDIMPETDAIRLVNVFPDVTGCRMRNGFRVHTTGLGSGAVQTLAEFSAADGTRRLVAAANGNLYNATSYNVAASSLGSGYSNNKWQTVNFRATGSNYLVLVNGVDTPKKWDGTTLSDAAYTVSGSPSTLNLIHVNVFKQRLYLVEANETSVWYTATNAVQGALTEFDIGSLLKRGGSILLTASWSADGGSGLEDYFIILSTMGEALIYAGSNPADFSLVSRLFLPPPLGRRAAFNVDNDVVILTTEGAISLSAVMATGDDTRVYNKVSDKIFDAYNTAARGFSNNYGWEGFIYPRGHALLLNVPVIESQTSEQYVMNLLNGSWCRYTGINACAWGLLNDKPYFGGTDGKIYEFDTSQSDNGNFINIDIKTAFTYFGDRERVKRVSRVTPILVSDPNVAFYLDVDADFSDKSITNVATTAGTTGADWDTSDWNTTDWALGSTTHVTDGYAVADVGKNIAIRCQGSLKNVTFSLNAFHLIYESGGLL